MRSSWTLFLLDEAAFIRVLLYIWLPPLLMAFFPFYCFHIYLFGETELLHQWLLRRHGYFSFLMPANWARVYVYLLYLA